jgi:hypothetical protein
VKNPVITRECAKFCTVASAQEKRAQPEEHLNSSDSEFVVQGTAQLDAMVRDLHLILNAKEQLLR